MAADYKYISGQPWSGGVYPTNLYIPMTAVGDFDGDSDNDGYDDDDGAEEFLVTDKIYYFDESNGTIELYDQQIYSSFDSYNNNMYYDLAAAGDVTGDGIDEIVYIKAKDLPWANLRLQHSFSSLYIWGQSSSGNYGTIRSMAVTSDEICPTVALANVDDDSFIVQFKKRELKFSDPVILAVLASAPYTASPEMEIGDSETSFTLTSSYDESSSTSNGFYVDVSVGGSVE